MAKQTVTRASLAEKIYRDAGFSREEATRMVAKVLDEIAATLTKGEQVRISGFGTFNLLRKPKRMGRNPKTNQEVPIEPRRVVSFRASRVLKKRIEDSNRSN